MPTLFGFHSMGPWSAGQVGGEDSHDLLELGPGHVPDLAWLLRERAASQADEE